MLVLLLPVLVAALWSTLILPRPLTPLATLLGPWAGHFLGHHECTLSSAWPAGSLGMSAAGPLLAFAWWRARAAPLRVVTSLALFGWTSCWAALALLSVLNAAA